MESIFQKYLQSFISFQRKKYLLAVRTEPRKKARGCKERGAESEFLGLQQILNRICPWHHPTNDRIYLKRKSFWTIRPEINSSKDIDFVKLLMFLNKSYREHRKTILI